MVRNGYLPERELQTGVGPVTVKIPKVRAKTGEVVTFRSALVPPYVRKIRSLEVMSLYPGLDPVQEVVVWSQTWKITLRYALVQELSVLSIKIDRQGDSSVSAEAMLSTAEREICAKSGRWLVLE